MRRLGDILDVDLPMDGEMKEVVGMAKLHLTAADTVLKVQVRVDDARLKRQTLDILPEIAEILKAEKAKLERMRTIEATT